MAEAYEVAAGLILMDGVSQPLYMIAMQFEKFDRLLVNTRGHLRQLGMEASGMREIGKATQVLDKYLSSADVHAAALERRLAGMKALNLGSGSMVPAMISGTPGNGYGRRGGGGFGGGHGGGVHVGPGGIGMGSASFGLGDAFIPLAVAGAGAYASKEFFDAARDYQNAYNQFKALNLGGAANAQADFLASHTHVTGVSQTDMMKVLGESTGLFGSFEEASKYAPQIAALAKANAAVLGEKSPDLTGENLMGLLKFIDRRGGFKDEGAFAKQLDLAEHMLTGSGGRLSAGDLDKFSQRGGTAFRGLSETGIAHMMGILIEQGGSSSGVALMSMYQNLVAGRTTAKAMGEMSRLGLGTLTEINDGSVGGKRKTHTALKNIQGMDELRTDPVGWIRDVLLPTLANKGITKQDDVIQTVNDIMSNRTASNQATMTATQLSQIMRDYKLEQGSMGTKDVQDLYGKSAQAAQDEFSAAWVDFKKVFGTELLPQFTNMLHGMTGVLRWIGDHSETISKFTSIMMHIMPGFSLPGWGGGSDGGGKKPVAIHGSAGAFSGYLPTNPNFAFNYGNTVDTVNPGGADHVAEIHTHVHMDGEEIAHKVIRKVVKSSPAPSGGLSFNGADMFGGPVPFATN